MKERFCCRCGKTFYCNGGCMKIELYKDVLKRKDNCWCPNCVKDVKNYPEDLIKVCSRLKNNEPFIFR